MKIDGKRVCAILHRIISTAEAGGMAPERAERIYSEIVGCWAALKAEFAGMLLAAILQCIIAPVTPDE